VNEKKTGGGFQEVGGGNRRRRKEELAAWKNCTPCMHVGVCVWNVWIYMPCFFWSSRSSFQRVLTPSIMTWTSCTSE